VIKEMDLKLAERGIRWVSYDRPGYMSSTARPGRDKASVAADAAAVADALGIGEFAVLGHSGGGSHALACGAARTTGTSRSSAPAVSRPWTGW
jgi:pimeloyl-ACP methyl ester carboxylesterase